MRENCGIGLYMVTILLVAVFGCLPLPAECRPGLLDAGASRSYLNSFANMSTNATAASSNSSDESKLTLQFCTQRQLHCVPAEGELCYCCENQKPSQPRCFLKPEECKANCPYCTPKCPSPPPETSMGAITSDARL
ncbi:hypothetical protein C2845_PM01G36330 [Panicum miliaceum]|uniref:Uncharacterized protein n=1 Tax=Panicum miliaceum TaxID=4540 RepID=A0A3L6TQ27_PANMI|nr:hypothetical protein C2845_PM01G36330 [Panicum miliaceum]